MRMVLGLASRMVLPMSEQGDGPGTNDPKIVRKNALIIWGVLFAALVMVAVAGAIVGPSIHRGVSEHFRNLFGVMAIIMSIVCRALSIILPRTRMGRPPSLGWSPDVIAMTRTILALALNEGAGLFAVVAWTIAGSPWALLALLVSAFGFRDAFPSQSRWKALGGLAAELLVTLDRQGAVKDIKVSRSSGLGYIDEVAMGAFQGAQSFGPLPLGALDEHRDVRFTYCFRVERRR